MKTRIIYLIALMLGIWLSLTSTVHGEIITIGFEDLGANPMDQADLPVHYAGLTWDSNWDYYNYLQWPLEPESSGPVRIIYGEWIDFGTDVTFLGSWVGTFAWGGDKYWLGYNDGKLIYESPHIAAGIETQGWINVYWPNVDYVKFVADGGNYAIDDIRYIPEPASLLLLGLGSIILRKRHTSA